MQIENPDQNKRIISRFEAKRFARAEYEAGRTAPEIVDSLEKLGFRNSVGAPFSVGALYQARWLPARRKRRAKRSPPRAAKAAAKVAVLDTTKVKDGRASQAVAAIRQILALPIGVEAHLAAIRALVCP
jgi:hypothetical protein